MDPLARSSVSIIARPHVWTECNFSEACESYRLALCLSTSLNQPLRENTRGVKSTGNSLPISVGVLLCIMHFGQVRKASDYLSPTEGEYLFT